MKKTSCFLVLLLPGLLFSACKTAQDDCCRADAAPPAERRSSWIVLFDGKLTDQLRGYKTDSFPKENWVIEDGALKTIPGKPLDLVTREKFRDFELEYEWKVAAGGNSGVMYNVAETETEAWMTGPEMQVVDDIKHPDGKNPKTTAGSLYALIAPHTRKSLRAVGEFNKARIISRNGHVEHWLNGSRILEYDWGSPQIKELIAQSKFKDMPRFMSQKEGHIDFQHHGEEAWYRNMRVRRL